MDAYHSPGGGNKSVEWATPQPFFAIYDAEFKFTLDAAAREGNAKCARFFTPEEDGLRQSWAGEVVWCNPPYGRGSSSVWVQKAYEEAQKGATVVMLVPARTDTAWWHDYAMKGEIRFVRGRMRFTGASAFAPFPSAVIIFRPPVP